MGGLNRSTGSACLGPSPGATLRGRSHHALWSLLCHSAGHSAAVLGPALEEGEKREIKNFEARVIASATGGRGSTRDARPLEQEMMELIATQQNGQQIRTRAREWC